MAKPTEYETPEGGQWHTEDQRKDLVHDILEESKEESGQAVLPLK